MIRRWRERLIGRRHGRLGSGARRSVRVRAGGKAAGDRGGDSGFRWQVVGHADVIQGGADVRCGDACKGLPGPSALQAGLTWWGNRLEVAAVLRLAGHGREGTARRLSSRRQRKGPWRTRESTNTTIIFIYEIKVDISYDD